MIPAAVPFHTSKEKVLCENTTTSAVTPGRREEGQCASACMKAAVRTEGRGGEVPSGMIP